MLIVCGLNGYEAFYWTEVGGVWELREDIGSLGNTSSCDGHPSGQYALAISWSGRRVARFEGGVMTSGSEHPWFTTRAILGVEFQQDGRRALVYGQAMDISAGHFATAIEYRHDEYDCPAPLTSDCDLTEVSIPNFGSPPWSAPNNASIADVAWRPNCDGGIAVGGASGFSTDWGFVATWEIEGGESCW